MSIQIKDKRVLNAGKQWTDMDSNEKKNLLRQTLDYYLNDFMPQIQLPNEYSAGEAMCLILSQMYFDTLRVQPTVMAQKLLGAVLMNYKEEELLDEALIYMQKGIDHKNG